MRWFIALVASVIAWFRALLRTTPPAIHIDPMPEPKEIDWFLIESDLIQRNGYAPWLDQWRYDGTDFAFPDPTPEQRRKVFMMSQARAIERYGRERVITALQSDLLDNLPVDMDAPAYERAKAMGQDPVAWALKKMRT